MLKLIRAKVDRVGARLAAWALRSEDELTPADSLFWALAGSGAQPSRSFHDEPVEGDPENVERVLRIRVASTSGRHIVCYDYDATGRWLRRISALPVEALT